jgi:hypothetical protein
MNTMEFEELQKIWDSQNGKPLFAVNEKALHNRILAKKKQAHQITQISELLLIVVNLMAGTFVVAINFYGTEANIFMYLMAFWMWGTALYVGISRIRRKKGDHRFDRSMMGDLSHAISAATYQVRLSQLMRWNILPIAALILFGVWFSGKPFWAVGLILILFGLAYYAGVWEHGIYKARKRELEMLQIKLGSE